MSRYKSLFVDLVMLALLLMAGITAAQSGGRERPRPGGGIPTAMPTLSRSGNGVPTLDVPTLTHPGRPAGTPVPTLTRPNLPTLPPTSGTAEAAVVNFAATYLGFAPGLLYAGDFTSTSSSVNQVLDAVIGQLPAEVQTFVETASSYSSAAYWGVWQIGGSVVAVGDCSNNPNCTFSVDNLNLYMTNSAAGVYGLYTPGQAATAADALNLILATYPGLAGLSFEEVPAETGFAFQSLMYDAGKSASAQYVFAGALGSGGQAFVYVVVAVGDGYIQLAQG